MKFKGAKVLKDIGRKATGSVPDTGHPVLNGMIRGGLLALAMVILLCAIGSITRCSAVMGANQQQGQGSQQQQGQPAALTQPGDDVPNGDNELSRLDRQAVLEGTVAGVVDGDTLVVSDPSGANATIRMIGIDAPDTAHPDPSKNTPAGAASKAYLESLVREGQTVWLTRDSSGTDHYGRMLCYVWLKDPNGSVDPEKDMVNALMVKEGYAEPKACEPDTRYADLFDKLAKGETSSSGDGKSDSASSASSTSSSSSSGSSSTSSSSSASTSSASSSSSTSSASASSADAQDTSPSASSKDVSGEGKEDGGKSEG